MRVPFAMRFQSLWIMFPDFTSVHLLRLMWSFTVFPRKGKSSTVISGRNPFDCNTREENPLGIVFFFRNKCEVLYFLLQISLFQNGQLKIRVIVIWVVLFHLASNKIIQFYFFSPGFVIDPQKHNLNRTLGEKGIHFGIPFIVIENFFMF